MSLTMAGAAAVAGGLSAGTGLVGSLIGMQQAKKDREFNAEEAQKNRDFQREERLAAQEWELDMWNRTNEYNSIGSQIERARAAGVNPASIVGGEYKSAQADTLDTSPQPGSMASTSSGAAVGSAIASSWPNIGNSFAQGVKGLIDSKVSDEMLEYNKKHLDSVVQHNLASIQKMAHDNGLTDVTAEQIRKSISWMDGLNSAEIKLKAAQATNLYNQNYEIYQRIIKMHNDMNVDIARLAQDIEESESRIAVNTAQTSYTSTLEDYQENRNLYADALNQAELTQQEVLALESEKRKEFAETYNIPLGSSEFEFAWALHLQGKYAEYCDKCILPAEQATWKPREWTVDDYTFDRRGTRYYFGGFNPRMGIVNPDYTAGGATFSAKSSYHNR